MSSERWRQIEELYRAAQGRDPKEMEAFVAEACGGDEALKREVELLLTSEPGTEVSRVAPEPLTEPLSMTKKLAPGSQLGHYTIRQPLGEGGMGTVYQATDTTLGRLVALKLLRTDFLQDSGAMARLEREARTLASLNHPHIAAIYSFEEHGGRAFWRWNTFPAVLLPNA